MYNPENIRRRQKDRAGADGGAEPVSDGMGQGPTLSVSAATSMASSPVFEGVDAGRSRAGAPMRSPAGPASRLRQSSAPACGWHEASRPAEGAAAVLVPARRWLDRHERVASLFEWVEQALIPRLVRYDPGALHQDLMKPTKAEFEAFFDRLLQDDEAGIVATIDRLHGRGVSMRSVFMELLVPAARRMGERWCDDTSDFVAVTVAVGHLQRMVQRYSEPFCAEGVPHGRGHRILMAQPEDETHSFGLSLVSEFFRRDGWDVVMARAGTGLDPVQCVRSEVFDAVGLSVGSQLNLPWLRERIVRIRRESCNPSIVVMVGGPLFADQPERATEYGADLSASADEAPAQVLECLARRDVNPSPSDGGRF